MAPPRALTAMSRMAVTVLGAHRVTSQLAVTTPGACSDVTDGGEHTCVPSTQYTPVVPPFSRTCHTEEQRAHRWGAQLSSSDNRNRCLTPELSASVVSW